MPLTAITRDGECELQRLPVVTIPIRVVLRDRSGHVDPLPYVHGSFFPPRKSEGFISGCSTFPLAKLYSVRGRNQVAAATVSRESSTKSEIFVDELAEPTKFSALR
jgi:hypothetical protein